MPHLIGEVRRIVECLRDLGADDFAEAATQAMDRDFHRALHDERPVAELRGAHSFRVLVSAFRGNGLFSRGNPSLVNELWGGTPGKFVSAERGDQHATRVRSPEFRDRAIA